MNDDSSLCDSSSSCSDDWEDNCVESYKAETSRKVCKNRDSQRHGPKRASLQASSLGSLSSEDEINPRPPHRRQRKTNTPPSSTQSIATARIGTSRKAPPASLPRSFRKRRLPRPPDACGNPSDTSSSSSSSSSSSDDSLIFRSSHSLTGTAKNREKTATKFAVNGESSDSDDTAELLRKLTGKPPPRKNFDAGPSVPSPQVTGASSSSSPKAERSPFGNYSGNRINKFQPSDDIDDRDNNEADDESSLDSGFDDGVGKSSRRQATQLSSNPGTKSAPQKLPEEVHTNIYAKPSPDIQNNNARNKPLHDNKSNSPVRFELPTQSSSSEESSASGEEDQSTYDEAEELGNSRTTDDRHSFSGGIVTKDIEKKNDASREEMVSIQDSHRHRQEHEAEQCASQTDRDLFEVAFDDDHNGHSRNTARGTPEEDGLRDTSSQRQESAALPRGDGVVGADEKYNGGSLVKEIHWEQPFQAASQQQYHHHRHNGEQHPCIDLVDSDDNEQNVQTQNARRFQNRRQEHHRQNKARVFENEESPRSPSQRKSPRFNIAARNFIYNKPLKNSTNLDHQNVEDDDVVQFENDEKRVPTRPRRVTQDHTSHVLNHDDNMGGRNVPEGPSVSHCFRNSHSSNAPSYQEQPLEQQASHRPSGVGSIPRPWNSGVRRMRDPTASNASLAASVVVKKTTRGGRTASKSSTASTAEQTNTQEHRRDSNIGDIRTFMRRPGLAYETRNRARAIEIVRSNRHDIVGHADVTVVNHPVQPKASGRRSRSRSQRLAEEEDEDVIEVFEEEEETRPARRPARSRKTTAAKATKPKAKTKRKRSSSRKTKSRKTGGRKRKSSGGKGRGRGRGGGGFGRRGGNSTSRTNDDSGAWGPTNGGWSSARPVHREDPAFQNVGAEITF